MIFFTLYIPPPPPKTKKKKKKLFAQVSNQFYFFFFSTTIHLFSLFFKTKQANKYKLTQKLYIVCRVLIGGAPFTVDVSKLKPNRPNTMNLVGKQA